MKVTNTGRTTATQCRGYLLRLDMKPECREVMPDHGEWVTIIRDTVPLRWSYTDEQHRGKDLFRDVPHYLDVVEAKESDTCTGICAMPRFPNFINIFRSPGLYRLIVQVVGEGVEPVVTTRYFRWHGDWRTFALWREGEEEQETPLLVPEMFPPHRVSPDAETESNTHVANK